MVVLPRLDGARVGVLEHGPAPLVVDAPEHGGADVREGMGVGLPVAHAPCQVERAVAELDRLEVALVQHEQLGPAAQRHRELAALRERLEDRDRLVGGRGRVGALARPPQDPREPAQVLPDAVGLLPGLVDPQERAPRLQGARELAAQVALDRDALQRDGARVRRERRLPVLERLAVAACGARRARGDRRVPADRRGVTGLAGVVGETSGIDAVGRLQRAEHPALELAAPRGADLALDRPPREVVAEDDGVAADLEDPRSCAGVDGRRARGHRVGQQAQPGCTGDDGGDLRDSARLRTERADAHGHGVADRGRDRAGRGREHLGDEERVAARHLMQIARGSPGAAGERVDGRLGERRRLDAPQDLGRDRPERPADLRPLGERLRPARHHEAPTRAREASSQERHEVERRVVGPVHVLDDEDRPRAGQLVEDRHQERLARPVGPERLRQRTAGVARHVAERAQRARRDERVARAPQHAARSDLLADRRDQRGLADPSLAADDHDAPLRPGCVERRSQECLLVLTLE